jgi:response regulator RpfG family c-di-GMP phosphodiesterase
LGAGVPAQACGWIRASAERFDGRGPAGLAGERVPLEARIVRVACGCDTALTAPRAAGSVADRRATAFAMLRTAAGRELDPRIVDALTSMLERLTHG